MPIGKNAIKRVTSTKAEVPEVKVEAPKAEEKKEAKAAPKAAPKVAPKAQKSASKPTQSAPKKAPTKKTAPKATAPKKSMESEPSLSPVKTLEKVTSGEPERIGGDFVSIGMPLPYYLL